jgi:hypothetical protein
MSHARRRLLRFAGIELLIWASVYPAYLLVRSTSIGSREEAIRHGSDVVDVERSVGIAHEGALQHHLHGVLDFFSAYYMLGFGPLLACTLVWLGIRRRELYRELRTLLFVSLGIAVVGYVSFPTAPPRLVPSLGVADSVGMSGHDTGSVAGVRFNPYAAMPSMHVGWSVLVALIGFRATRSRLVRAFFVLHPLVMATTVTATGNHYFLDSIAGAAAAFAAVGLIAVRVRIRIPVPRLAFPGVRTPL